VLLALFAIVLLYVSLALHTTPFYFVETDLLGDNVPTAEALRHGEAAPVHFQYKGPGYPLLLAVASPLVGNDYYLAARLLNVASAVIGAWFAFLLFRSFMGSAAGLFVLVGLALNPVYVRAAIEAGTDAPAFAFSITATYLVLRGQTAWAPLLGGLLTGYAILIRYNFAFLVLAAIPVLFTRSPRVRAAALYGMGLVVPVGAWLLANWKLTGHPLTNLNYLNFAYSIYGQGTPWDLFWSDAADRFHSLWDVVRFDPPLVASYIGTIIATRWLTDIRELLPLWLGVFAIGGVGLIWLRRPGWGGVLLHFALCYLVLVSVFYTPRFFLYLIPFYLGGAAAILLLLRKPGEETPLPRSQSRPARGVRTARLVVAGTLLAFSGNLAVSQMRLLLDSAPHEARSGGVFLKAYGQPGEKVMARKPHAAYFAGMEYVPMPLVRSVTEIIDRGRQSEVDYLYFSGLESNLRRELQFLNCPGVNLPGLKQVHFGVMPVNRYFSIFEFTGEPISEIAMEESLIVVLPRVVAAYGEKAFPYTDVGAQLTLMGRYRRALPLLEQALSLDSHDFTAAEYKAKAHEALGEFALAASVCMQVIATDRSRAWFHATLGKNCILSGKPDVALPPLQEAVEIEPTNTEYLSLLGQANLMNGNPEAAARQFEAALALGPDSERTRLHAARALVAAGQRTRALILLEPAPATEADTGVTQRRVLADSIRALAPKD
jgi:Flp pilus assembly protein TadD